MKLSELLKDLTILESTASMDMEITGVSYDSRKTQPGDLFVAITGYETEDGTSRYIRQENRVEKVWEAVIIEGYSY